MKSNLKKITALLCCLLMALSLCACSEVGSKPPEASESTAQGGKPLQEIYDKMAASTEMPEMMSVPDDMLMDYYGIDKNDCEELVVSICVNSLRADEVVLCRAKDADAAARIEQKLQARLKAKADEAEGYSPEQYAIIIECEVLADGNNVAMIVAPEAKGMVEIYKSMK